MKYIKKPIVIEAITFDELAQCGRLSGAQRYGEKDMPWSFTYKGHAITHENDDRYLIPTLEGTMNFNRGDMLITGVQGEIYPCKMDIFEATYDRVSLADESPDLIAAEKDRERQTFELVYCDCDQSTACPNGKAGSEDRCAIMRRSQPLEDAVCAAQDGNCE